jgi:photosystem II stability/assembly factor-like uncharacterized protein
VARQLVAAPSDPRVLYLASHGGVFRSDDSGTTWRNVSGPIETSPILAVDPHDPNTVFAAWGTEFSSVYKTTDGGATWLFTGLSGVRASAIVIDPRDSNVVYVGAACGVIFSRGPRTQAFEGAGVYKSTDGGATFQSSSNGLDGFTRCVTGLSLNPLDPDTLFTEPVFGDGGYARSDDAGATWQIAKVVQPGRKVLADPRNPDRLYGVGKQGLVISEDRGATWTRKTPRALEGPELFGVEHIAVDPASGRLFALSGRLYRSGDGGATFLPIPFAPMEPIYTMAFDATTGTLIAGTPTSVYQSRGFPWEQWTEVPTGDRSLEMRGIAASLRDPDTAYASSQGRVYVTRDAGRSWQPLPRPPFSNIMSTFVLQLVVDAGENLYARVNGSGAPLFKLPAGSDRWVPLGEGSSGILSVDPRVPGVVYSATTGGYRVTRDGGATWNWIFLPDRHGYSLAVDPDDSNVLYGVASGGLVKSVDGGHTWSLKLAESVSLDMVPAVSPADGGATIYVAVRDLDAEYNISLYRSTDAGETWTRRAFPNGHGVLSLVADPRDARTFYVSMQRDGVYRTTDGGETYQPIQFGLPAYLGWLAVNNTGTVLHATSWNSMWELSLVPGRRRAVR